MTSNSLLRNRLWFTVCLCVVVGLSSHHSLSALGSSLRPMDGQTSNKSKMEPVSQNKKKPSTRTPSTSEPNAAPAPPPQKIRRSEGVMRSLAIKKVAPEMPPEAKARRIFGDVVVEITVSTQGDVLFARCVSGHQLLQEAAVTAARQWKFKSPLVAEYPTHWVTGILTFRFPPSS